MGPASLYVVSTETFSGKSALCVGLGRRMETDGFSVGYLKPVSVSTMRTERDTVDEDAAFIGPTLGLNEPRDLLAPILLTSTAVRAILRGARADYDALLLDAFHQVAAGKQAVLLEGANDWTEGSVIGLPAARVADLLDARVMLVSRYQDEMTIDSIVAARDSLGEAMVGVVLNVVPAAQMGFVQDTVTPFLEARGIQVLAALPQDKLLLSISVAEIAAQLGGEVLCREDHLEDLVENLMIGAMGAESALTYFRRRLNKAVITGGDRADIQMAALETSTRCLVLTGNLQPNPAIIVRATELGIPILLVSQDTLAAVESIEHIFGKVRFHQQQKIERFQNLLDSEFRYDALYDSLGLERRR